MQKIISILLLLAASACLNSLTLVWAQEDSGATAAQPALETVDAPGKLQAIEAANVWLGLVDNSSFDQSWEQASSFFKGTVTQQSWTDSLGGVRTSMGKLLKRELFSVAYSTQLPGAPDGEYFVIIFKSSFENKADTIETVTPKKDDDGLWHVAGYYIR